MNGFSTTPFASSGTGSGALALALSVLLGALIGFEREVHGHPAGLRTHILVSLGACLATVVSIQMAAIAPGGGDPARLAAQVVTGIGFLGAGAIIRDRGSIRGLTTAASIWTTAMIGIGAGATPRSAALAVLAAVIVVGVLWWLHHAEKWMDRRGTGIRHIEVHTANTASATSLVMTAILSHGAAVNGIDQETARDGESRQLQIRLRGRRGLDFDALLAELSAMPDVRKVSTD